MLYSRIPINYVKKKEESDKKSASSLLVPLTVLFSEPFLHDLELIWNLSKTIKPTLFENKRLIDRF
jgi:hypothetical protein